MAAPVTYASPAPAPPSWPSQTHPWTNPYGAEQSPSPSRRTATITALAIIAGILAIVVTAELSHYLTLRHETAPAPTADSAGVPFTAPTYVPPVSSPTSALLPASIAGLNLNPQSPGMRHHLTEDAESELSASIGPTIGYYEAPDGGSKVFLETIDAAPAVYSSNPSVALSRLEASFDDELATPAGSTSRPTWTRVATGDANSVMNCEHVVEYSTPIFACAFVQGSTIGVIGVNQPAPGVDPLINEVRRAITGS